MQAAALEAGAGATEFSSSPGERDVFLAEASAAGAEASASASCHEVSATDAPTAASSSATGAAPARDSSLPPLSDRRSRHPRMIADEQKKATHVASVASAPATGGVVSDFLEGKRLGKLFDEWKTLQGEDVEGVSQTYGYNTRSPAVRLTDDSTHDPFAGTLPSPKSKAKLKAGKGRGRGVREAVPVVNTGLGRKRTCKTNEFQTNRDQDRATAGLEAPEFGGDSDFGSDVVDHHESRMNESKLVGRLFQVVSNPKVTSNPRDMGDSESTRKVPQYIEGFPTINLMRLYRGPWRLDA